eukprot:7993316-Pyramimonas_sp.AAC.1
MQCDCHGAGVTKEGISQWAHELCEGCAEMDLVALCDPPLGALVGLSMRSREEAVPKGALCGPPLPGASVELPVGPRTV